MCQRSVKGAIQIPPTEPSKLRQKRRCLSTLAPPLLQQLRPYPARLSPESLFLSACSLYMTAYIESFHAAFQAAYDAVREYVDLQSSTNAQKP